MFPDPEKLNALTPAEVLAAAARGHLGVDHRFLHALLDREAEAKPAVLKFANSERDDLVDLTPELVALFRHWRTPEALPFLIGVLKDDPQNIPDEAMEVFVGFGEKAVEPLLQLYGELEEEESGEVAFLLASLGIHDARILKLLEERIDFDIADTALSLETYRDPAAIPILEKTLAGLEDDVALKQELEAVIATIRNSQCATKAAKQEEEDKFDIWHLYPEREDVPVDALDEDERFELFSHASPKVRTAAIHSFFNQELSPEQETKTLELARTDPDAEVRGSAWQTLINSTEDEAVLDAMLAGLRNPSTPLEERAGLLIGLSPEADRNEVRNAIVELYKQPGARAKALEAMWRSMNPAFRDHFAKHLNDADAEVRRSAIWGVGYFGVRSELDKLRGFFEDEELRMDALFAYALAIPGDTSRARVKGLLSRIEKDAKGLSEMEEELVKAALDERLLLAGKEPVFRGEDD